ncbi:hypothetical protein [Dokdonia sp.]|uniref:hypothetical protein n=1 Tax=Dokdonia sp. TaxID=2024995 RepID=UPI0032640B6D
MLNKFDPTELDIIEHKIVQGHIESPFEFDSDLIENYKTDMSFNASFVIEKKLVKAYMGFVIQTNSESDQKESNAEFDFVYVFRVGNIEELLTTEEDGEINDLELTLLTAIAAISFSTSRGILMTRLQGTVMKDYILPVIDPKKLLEEWAGV